MPIPVRGVAIKSIQLIVQLALGVGLLLATILPAYPHGGGLDAHGCYTTASGRSHAYLVTGGQEQTAMTMQPYKGYFIDGSALLVHPFSSNWYVGGSVLMQGRATSIVEITRFQLQQFTVSMKELAEWFGLELARIAVDELLGATK